MLKTKKQEVRNYANPLFFVKSTIETVDYNVRSPIIITASSARVAGL